MTSMTSTELVPVDEMFTHGERMALLGFLAAYRGATSEAYASDLRQFSNWCAQHHLRLFATHRVDIECFARDLEARGRARATVARRLCTVTGFYRYAEEEGLIGRSPAVHVRRPRRDYESHAVGPDRNELGAILVAAGLSGARDHALVSLLALNGLRISEALGADIDALGLERGPRTLTVCHKGGKIVTKPLAPRVARAIDLAIGERPAGPIFLSVDGERLERHAAARIVRRVARRAGSTSASDPTRSATPSSRCARRRCATARRPGGRQPRRPTHDHALRPRPPGPRPARHLHRRHLRRHLRRRRQPLNRDRRTRGQPPTSPRAPILERSARRSTQDKIADTREFSMCAPAVLYARSRTIWRLGYVRAFGPRDRIDGTSRIGNPMEGLGGCCGVDRSVSGPGGRILAARSSPALGGGRSAELGPQRGVMRR
jgi:integrase/recombinase XerD